MVTARHLPAPRRRPLEPPGAPQRLPAPPGATAVNGHRQWQLPGASRRLQQQSMATVSGNCLAPRGARQRIKSQWPQSMAAARRLPAPPGAPRRMPTRPQHGVARSNTRQHGPRQHRPRKVPTRANTERPVPARAPVNRTAGIQTGADRCQHAWTGPEHPCCIHNSKTTHAAEATLDLVFHAFPILLPFCTLALKTYRMSLCFFVLQCTARRRHTADGPRSPASPRRGSS